MAGKTLDHQLRAEIGLTLSEANEGNRVGSVIQVRAGDFIAYETGVNGTRLMLTGHRVIMVRESTDEIDRLLTQAQTNRLQFLDAMEEREAA